MSESNSQARVVVQGRVYGVHYGGTVVSQAARLGLVGWVQEHPSGRVEFVVEGPKELIEEILDWAEHDGPPSAKVESVEVTWGAPSGDFDRFQAIE
jgi:acylphosphatase